MSQAESLLNRTTEDDLEPYVEEHIVIGRDRYITVPEPLQRIAVQYDHNVETVTFDCPRYWDEHDLSTMYIYINYLRSDGVKGAYLAKNVRVNETDTNLIHFDWTIGNEISLAKGTIMFLVCAVKTDSEGIEEIHWNSEINKEMTVSDGLECDDEILNKYPDIITDLLTRMDHILIGDGTIIDTSLTQPGIAAEAKATGERLDTLDNNVIDINNRIDVLDEEVVKEEVDPTVPDWAKEPTKPSYSHDELTDGNTLALKTEVNRLQLLTKKNLIVLNETTGEYELEYMNEHGILESESIVIVTDSNFVSGDSVVLRINSSQSFNLPSGIEADGEYVLTLENGTLKHKRIVLDYVVESSYSSLELTDISLKNGKRYEIIAKPTGPAYSCSTSSNKMSLDGVQIYSASNLGDSPSSYAAWFIVHISPTGGIVYSNKSNPISHTFTCGKDEHVFKWEASGTYNGYTRTIINTGSRILIMEV